MLLELTEPMLKFASAYTTKWSVPFGVLPEPDTQGRDPSKSRKRDRCAVVSLLSMLAFGLYTLDTPNSVSHLGSVCCFMHPIEQAICDGVATFGMEDTQPRE